ncbi:unnamed protein product, partial [Ixodes hexagonus]
MRHHCKRCKKKFRSLDAFFEHTLYHETSSRGVPCSVVGCEAAFKTYSSLRSHVTRCHSRLAPRNTSNPAPRRQCTVSSCSEEVSSETAFIQHLKQHLIGSPPTAVNCPFECDSQLRTWGSLKTHLSIYHNKEKNEMVAAEPTDLDPIVTPCSSTDVGGQQRAGERLQADSEVPSGTQDVDPSHFNRDSFLESLALFTLKLESKYLIPSSTVQNILEDMKRLHGISQEHLKSALKAHLTDEMSRKQMDEAIDDSFVNSPFSAALSSDGALRTSYMRNVYYTKELSHNKPVQMSLGLDGSNEMRHYSYVPLKETLRTLLSNPDIVSRLSFDVQQSKDGVYREFTDGRAFQSQTSSDGSAVQIILYQDAFEVVNPLGSARGKFKMVGVYFTLGNLPSFLRTAVDPQQLVLLCHEKDFKHFGSNKLFERLISDLQDLEEGIRVGGHRYFVQLAFICGDNLGSHGIGGFVENFSRASYFCRYCVITREEFRNNRPAELRTVSSYNEAVTRAKESEEVDYMGVKHDSPFNKLSTFHVCPSGLPPCLGHDLFEGIVDYDVALMIKHFVKTLKWFSYHHLNVTIQSKFKYNACDRANKPAPVSINGRRLGGQALQNCTLLLLLPIMVGDKVQDASNEMWRLLLTLQEIVELVMATAISDDQVSYLALLISDYLHERRRLLPSVPLRPKHHYLTHYPHLIRQFGPLVKVWSLRFESKHSYFKRCIRASGNFINVTKSLAQKHQLFQSYLQKEGLYSPAVEFTDLTPASENANFDRTLWRTLQINLLPSLETLMTASSVTVCGTQYKPGCYIVLGGHQYNLHFGQLLHIVVESGHEETPLFLVRKAASTFVPDFKLYKLIDLEVDELQLLPPSHLKDIHAYVPYRLLNCLVIRLQTS